MTVRSTARTLAIAAALILTVAGTLLAPATAANAATSCPNAGGVPVSTIGPDLAAIAQTPGRRKIAYYMKDHSDVLLILVDDASGLSHDQMRLELDIDPVGMTGNRGVTWSKTLEAWSPCRVTRAAVLGASLRGGVDVGRDCAALSDTNDFRSGCTLTTTPVVVNRSTVGELWFRKPGFLGVWTDAEVLDSSIWAAFGGRSVRFIWRAD